MDRSASAGSPEDLSIIIPHYDGLDQLQACLDSLLASDASSAEVIVVDNASLDHCADRLALLYPQVTFVRSPVNTGCAGAWNEGARHARRRFLLFLNDDIRVPDTWVGSLVSALTTERVGCVCAVAFFEDRPDILNHAGGICDFLGFGENRAIGKPAATGLKEELPVFYAVATTLATRRDVWERVGGFDSCYFIYAEDLDWSWRVRLAGYEVRVEEAAIHYHRWGGSHIDLERMVFLMERNQLRNLLKNYAAGTLLLLTPIFLVVKSLRLLWLRLRAPPLARATLRAWGWNVRNLRDTWRVRRGVQALRRVGDREVMRYMVFESLEVAHGLGLRTHPLASGLGAGGDR